MSYTNRGAKLERDWIYRGVALPGTFYVALLTSTNPPTVDTNVLGDVTEIAAGNGYTAGGYALTPGTTDFEANVENDTLGRAETQIKELAWTASGGPIPASGPDARYACLTTDEGTLANRQVLLFWSLGADQSALAGQPFTLTNLGFRAATT